MATTRHAADFEQRLAALEPWLTRTSWGAMTYMLIPSVLQEADRLNAEMASYAGPEKTAVEESLARLHGLRAALPPRSIV